MTQYDYTKSPCSVARLQQEIQVSAIATTLDHVELFGDALSIVFPSALSGGDETLLNSIVSSHDGTPLSVDFNEALATSSTSTSSSSYTMINSMTSPYLLAGDYLITFTGKFSTTVPLLSTPGAYVALFNDGVQVTASEQSQVSASSGAPFNLSLTVKVTVGLNKKVEVRWKTNGAGNTVTCTNRVLDILKV